MTQQVMRISGPKNPCPIYHFTDIGNLEAILASGVLQCKKYAPVVVDASLQEIQSRRAMKEVEHPPHGVLHDYVPFYFNYLSPMLYKIKMRDHPTYKGSQRDLVYFHTNIGRVVAANLQFVFTTGHAEMGLSRQYQSLDKLPELAWDIIYGRYWFDNPPQYPDRKRRRQAEFLIHDKVSLNVIAGIAVMDQARLHDVQRLLSLYTDWSNLPTAVERSWYY